MGFSEQNGDAATIAAKVEQLRPEVRVAPPADDLGREPIWFWVLGYFTHIMLIQLINYMLHNPLYEYNKDGIFHLLLIPNSSLCHLLDEP